MLSGLVQEIEEYIIPETDKNGYASCHFQKTAVPAPPLAHSISMPSLTAQVMYQKFVMGIRNIRVKNDQ